jgi:hypothetical protein
MKMVLVVGLIITSALFASAGAQINQTPQSGTYSLSTNTTPVSLRVGRGEQRATGTYLQNVTLTVGDLVITSDDAMLIADNGTPELQLGANARLRFPAK